MIDSPPGLDWRTDDLSNSNSKGLERRRTSRDAFGYNPDEFRGAGRRGRGLQQQQQQFGAPEGSCGSSARTSEDALRWTGKLQRRDDPGPRQQQQQQNSNGDSIVDHGRTDGNSNSTRTLAGPSSSRLCRDDLAMAQQWRSGELQQQQQQKLRLQLEDARNATATTTPPP